MRRTFSIIGAGRVGRSLGRALRLKGWRNGAVVTRSMATARVAVRAIGGGTPHDRITYEVFDASTILICTPDDVIANVAKQVATAGKSKLRGKVVLHTSGAL